MPHDFAGKKVLITGAGQGIGRGLAQSMAERGAEVYALSRTKEYLDSLVAEHPSVTPLVHDLMDLDGALKTIEPHLPFHMLVNNAGTNEPQEFLEITQTVFDRCAQKLRILPERSELRQIAEQMIVGEYEVSGHVR